jgi:CBS domain-containing protein
MPTAKSMNRTLKRALDELTRARDEAKLELHLLGMDARRMWNDLEARAEALEEELTTKGGRAADASLSKVEELARSIRELVEQSPRTPSGITLTAGAVMTENARSCGPKDRLTDAARVLWEADCGVVPVVDPGGTVVGMLTDRDVCMAAYTKGLPLHDIAVEQVMARDVVTCSRGDSVQALLERMANNRVRRIPVVDAERRLLGVVSLADLALYAEELESDALLTQVARTLAVLSSPRGSHHAPEA